MSRATLAFQHIVSRIHFATLKWTSSRGGGAEECSEKCDPGTPDGSYPQYNDKPSMKKFRSLALQSNDAAATRESTAVLSS